MAPIRKRASLRTPASSSRPQAASGVKLHATGADASNGRDWRLSKKDKRTIKHNLLIDRVQDAGIKKSQVRRRRPKNKLAATEGMQEELAAALPDLEDGDDDGEWEGLSGSDENGETAPRPRRRRNRTLDGSGKMVLKSLRHRPGAMKRKRLMEEKEMERFQRNLAQLAGSKEESVAVPGASGEGDGEVARANKWEALRRFIGGSLQRDRAFETG